MLKLLLAAAALAAACAAQAQLVFDVADPAFRVSIPNFPKMVLERHPERARQPYAQLLGKHERYRVAVLTPEAGPGMDARACASAIVSQIAQRPGVPAAADIYRGQVDANTYVAIYVIPRPGFAQLNTHLLSAAGTRCVEVHASLLTNSRDDVEPWFKGFTDASITPKQ